MCSSRDPCSGTNGLDLSMVDDQLSNCQMEGSNGVNSNCIEYVGVGETYCGLSVTREAGVALTRHHVWNYEIRNLVLTRSSVHDRRF